MKKTFLLLIFTLLCFVVRAQMSRWIMQPVYDSIYIQSGAPLLVSDSLGNYTIWDINGKKLSVTDDYIHPFKGGLAITTEKNSDNITGFYNIRGEFIALDNCNIAHNYPYFRDGYLLSKVDNKFCFINSKGELRIMDKYLNVYPFNKGIATCFTYDQIDKLKDPYYSYETTGKDVIKLSYNDKIFEKTDVQFLSSINDEGVGVAIIQSKAYLFHLESSKLEQIFSNKNEVNIKNEINPKKQVTVEEVFTTLNFIGDSLVIEGKGTKIKGKNYEIVKFVFDKFLKLTKIHYADRTVSYKENIETEIKYSSPFTSFKSSGNKYGLNYNGNIVLPEQFDDTGIFVNDFAVVKKGNHWGMLTFDESLKFRLQMHNDKNIAFRHKEVATTVKLVLPPIISADKCKFVVDDKYGCTMDNISRETKNTESGNYVQYNCILSIPGSLPDDPAEIQYPVYINYDGIDYPTAYIKTKAWHLKYIDVDLEDSETKLEDGANVSFTIKLDIRKLLGEDDYPFRVGIQADTLKTELIKLSETRYKCKVFSLAEGINNVSIDIHEDGCPSSVFPFEITYIKPVEKTKTTPEVKEEVKVEKKVKSKKIVKEEGPILPI